MRVVKERREARKGNRRGQDLSLVVPGGWDAERRKLKDGVEGTRAFERGQRERRWKSQGQKVFVVGHNISFCDREVPVEDDKELAFHSTDVLFGEIAGPPSPSRVFDGVI